MSIMFTYYLCNPLGNQLTFEFKNRFVKILVHFFWMRYLVADDSYLIKILECSAISVHSTKHVLY